jgi:hypothetical protein
MGLGGYDFVSTLARLASYCFCRRCQCFPRGEGASAEDGKQRRIRLDVGEVSCSVGEM